jgi:hypothetical protein
MPNIENRKFDGAHLEDFWQEWIRGFKKREEATKDVLKLSNEYTGPQKLYNCIRGKMMV